MPLNVERREPLPVAKAVPVAAPLSLPSADSPIELAPGNAEGGRGQEGAAHPGTQRDAAEPGSNSSEAKDQDTWAITVFAVAQPQGVPGSNAGQPTRCTLRFSVEDGVEHHDVGPISLHEDVDIDQTFRLALGSEDMDQRHMTIELFDQADEEEELGFASVSLRQPVSRRTISLTNDDSVEVARVVLEAKPLEPNDQPADHAAPELPETSLQEASAELDRLSGDRLATERQFVARIEALRRDLDGLREELDSTATARSDAWASFEEDRAVLEERAVHAEKQARTLEERTQRETAEAREREMNLLKELQEGQAQLARTQRESEETVRAKDQSLERSRGKVAAKDREIQGLKSLVETADKEREARTALLQSLEAQVAALHKQLAVAQAANAAAASDRRSATQESRTATAGASAASRQSRPKPLIREPQGTTTQPVAVERKQHWALWLMTTLLIAVVGLFLGNPSLAIRLTEQVADLARGSALTLDMASGLQHLDAGFSLSSSEVLVSTCPSGLGRMACTAESSQFFLRVLPEGSIAVFRGHPSAHATEDDVDSMPHPEWKINGPWMRRFGLRRRRKEQLSCELRLQRNGRLVLADHGGSVLWRSPAIRGANPEHGTFHADLDDTGALRIVRDSDGKAVWHHQSRGAARRQKYQKQKEEAEATSAPPQEQEEKALPPADPSA